MQVIIPPINSTGKFTFKDPFKDKIDKDQELRVIGIRNIPELIASNEDPLEFIYKQVGLDEPDMQEDINNNIPIVVFITTGHKYIYVPADRIATIPKINGVLYQERMIGVPLGSLPVGLNYNKLLDDITTMVYDSIGVKSRPEVIDVSAKVLVDYETDNKNRKIRENRSKVFKSDKLRIKELEEALNKTLFAKIKLEEFIKNHFFNSPVILDEDVTVPELVAGFYNPTNVHDEDVTVPELVSAEDDSIINPDDPSVDELVNA